MGAPVNLIKKEPTWIQRITLLIFEKYPALNYKKALDIASHIAQSIGLPER